MKKIISLIILTSFFPNFAFADCDYSKIVNNGDGTYTYSKALHICVGEMKQDLEIANQQVAKLTKAISLKDLTITKADKRADVWMNTSFKLENRIQTIDSMSKTNDWLFFGLGIATMLAASYAAGQLNHR